MALALPVAACSDDGIASSGGAASSSSTAAGSSTALTAAATEGAGDTTSSASAGGTSGTSDGPPSASSSGGASTGGSSGAMGTSSSGSDSGGSSSGESTSTGEAESSGEESSSDGGPMCQPMGGSCAMGESCCAGLFCCAGVPVPPGAEFCGSMCPISDYKRKREFAAIDVDEVLDKVAALPITTWSYRHEDASIRHIGPMAQDFMASFDVGASDESIFVVDADGVSLASIQALHGRLVAAEADNAALRTTIDQLERRLAALEAR